VTEFCAVAPNALLGLRGVVVPPLLLRELGADRQLADGGSNIVDVENFSDGRRASSSVVEQN
jgi:hypothetical protein